MKSFYHNTYYFWIITKAILAIAGFIGAVSILNQSHRLRPEEQLANYVGVIYALLMAIDVISSLSGRYHKAIKYITGSISIILGVVLFVLLLNVKVISIPLTLLFVIWILLLGFFDLLQIKRVKVYDEYEGEQ